MKYELGIEVKDIVTGFKGILTGYAKYLTGCDQYLVAPPVDKEKKHVGANWYDVNRLKPIGKKPPLVLDTTEDKGACEPAPIK